MKNCHVPSQRAVIPSPRSMLRFEKRLPPDSRNLSETQGNVFGNPRPMFDSSRTPSQGILHSTTPSAAGAVPVQVSTGRPIARGEERIGSTTTMPISERRPSTMNLFLPMESPQNSMAGQQRLQISELQFDKFPTLSSFSCWKIRFKTQVSSCSDFPSEAMLWIQRSEMVDSVDELKSSRSIAGKNFPKFKMLDARIPSAFNKIIQNSHFKKKVSLEEQKAQKDGRFLRERQIPYMIYDYFRVTGAHGTVLDYADFFSITLRNDNVQEFDTRWDEILLSMAEIPSDDILECLYKLRIRESAQIKTVLELYDMEILQKISMPNYQKLQTMVKRSIDQKLRLRNYDARNERIETGAVITSGRGLSGIERGKGECYQWKAKGQCSRGDKRSFRHDVDKCAKTKPKTAPPSEPPTLHRIDDCFEIHTPSLRTL